MLRKTIVAAMLGVAALVLAACDTMDDEDTSSHLSQADAAYNACQPSYAQKADSLEGKWAFVSGVDDAGHGSCYWSWQSGSTADASNSAYNDCRKKYDACFVFATSDGPSDWVQRKSDELKARRANRNVTLSRVGEGVGEGGGSDDSGGSDDGSGGGSGDDGSSLGDFLGGLTDLLNAATGIVQATQGGGGGDGSVSIPSSDGYSQKGAFDDCARLYQAMGDAAGAAKCAQNSKNMETAH